MRHSLKPKQLRDFSNLSLWMKSNLNYVLREILYGIRIRLRNVNEEDWDYEPDMAVYQRKLKEWRSLFDSFEDSKRQA